MQKERLEFPQRQISRKRFTNLFLGRNLEFSLGALKQEISTQAISLATQSTTDWNRYLLANLLTLSQVKQGLIMDADWAHAHGPKASLIKMRQKW